MSLQVWLPLTKDLKNYGFNDAKIEEVTTAIFDTGGKLGNCLSGGKIKIPANQVASIFNNTSMSIAFWYNNNTSETTGSHAICGFSGNSEGDTDAVRIWDFFNYSVPTQFHWSMGNLGGGSLSNVFPANTWVHVCVTWQSPTLKIYINGELKYTGSGSSNYTFNKSYYISFGRTPQKLNDFRIYNHCLSPLEIKEILKGLMLHYPLNRGGLGQDNLYTGTKDFSGSSWGNYSGWTTESSTYNGFTVKSRTAQWGGLCQNIPATNGDIFTISFWAKVESGGTLVSIDRSNLGNVTTGLSIIGGNFTSGRDWVLSSQNATQWKYYWGTVQIVSSDITYLQWRIENSISNKKLSVCGFKLEKGNKPTPWCPNSADTIAATVGLNSTVEYDCSGCGNNGVRTGTFSWTSDTPKYQVSTAIEQGKITSTNSFLTTADPVFSVALWFKLKSGVTYTSFTDLISFSSSSYSNQPFRLEICGSPAGKDISWFRGPSGQSGGFGVGSNLSFDTWYHTVLVSEGNKQYTYYLNGERKGTYNGSANSWTPTGNVSLGENIAGVIYESDFRIYATALSADDIKSLYQNEAFIDSSGTIYGQIR